MKIVFLTPGTGSYHCGACMRDNALAQELLRAGEEVTLAPMYLPHTLDEAALPQRASGVPGQNSSSSAAGRHEGARSSADSDGKAEDEEQAATVEPQRPSTAVK